MGQYWEEDEDDLYGEILEEYDDEAEYEYDESYEDADEDEISSVNSNSAFSLSNHEASVVHNARLRLEQAKLYEMLINHNVFDGVDASSAAIEKVQKDLKVYLVDRLEVLLGIKKKKISNKILEEKIVVESIFNDIEVDFIKALALKGTKGQSAHGEPFSFAQKPKESTTSIVSVKKAVKPRPVAIKPKPLPTVKKIKKLTKEAPNVKKVAKKVRRRKRKSSRMEREGTLTKKDAAILAREELNEEERLLGRKITGKLTKEEATEIMVKRAKENAMPRPANALPMQTAQDMESYAMGIAQSSQISSTFMGNVIQNAINEDK